jgi:hypothetical protein
LANLSSGLPLNVRTLDGRVIGSARVSPGDDAKAAARKILREQCSGFHAPLTYRNLNVV